jgi:hypothetical protein
MFGLKDQYLVIKLLKLNANVIVFFVVYFCGIWAFSSSRKSATLFLLHMLYQMMVNM